MSEDLDKLKQALRKGEYASLKASSLENKTTKEQEPIATESQEASKSSKPKNGISFLIYLTMLLFVALVLVVYQWQTETTQTEAKLEQIQKELSTAKDENDRWRSENETGNTELQRTREQLSSLQEKLNSQDRSRPNVLNLMLKYKYNKYQVNDLGFSDCNMHFSGFAEGDWNEDWTFQCNAVDTSLTQGEVYMVSLCLVDDEAGYTDIGFCGARIATPEERVEFQRY